MSYTTRQYEEDTQCMLKVSHVPDHKLPPKETDHKCKSDLDCSWCGGYWLKGFNRCNYMLIDLPVWVEKGEEANE